MDEMFLSADCNITCLAESIGYGPNLRQSVGPNIATIFFFIDAAMCIGALSFATTIEEFLIKKITSSNDVFPERLQKESQLNRDSNSLCPATTITFFEESFINAFDKS